MKNFDWWLVIPCLLLSSIGLTMLRAVSPDLSSSQLLFFIFATLVFVAISRTDYLVFFSLYRIGYLVSVLFLLTPFLFGSVSRGAVRWIQIGSLSFQPSEIVKPFLLIAFSVLAASASNKKTRLLLLSAAIPLGIIFFQPDLGTTLVIFVGWATVLLTQTSVKTVALAGMAFAFLLFPVYRFALHEYQRQRIVSFLNPYHDPLGQGYHVIQSMIAAGSGGFLGRGLGHGTQSQLRFLPEYHTDFIFSSLGESLGLVGSISVIAIFLFLIWRIYEVSQTTQNRSAAFFCVSFAALLAFQVFVNIGMNLGLVPVTGITLPFLSYGGSSLLSLAIMLGIVNSISVSRRQTRAT